MKLREIIDSYSKRYKEKNISEELSSDIDNIDVSEYVEYQIEEYNKIQKQSNGKILQFNSDDLKEYNKFFSAEIRELFKNDVCIFDHDGKDDNNFFIKLNNSDFVKDLLDEKNEHFPLENGRKLDGALMSVCSKKIYANGEEFDALSMYAEAWWKLAKSHSFSNGNKRTAFIGMKSMMLSDVLFNWIDKLIDTHNHDHITEILNEESKENIWKSVKKSSAMFCWKKPKKQDVFDFINKYVEIYLLNVWESLYNDEQIFAIINSIVADIGIHASKGITADYILSKFIAKIPMSEYNDNDEKVKKEVLNVIEANLILTMIVNQQYLLSKVSDLTTRINPILSESIKNYWGTKNFIKHFSNDWNKNNR